jgi:hypothetical protein
MTLLSKEQSRARWAELRGLLNEWDPIGVMSTPEGPRDEYDCLAGPVMRMLEAGVSQGQIADFLRQEMTEHFGLPSEPDGVRAVARRIRKWFQQRWAGTMMAG